MQNGELSGAHGGFGYEARTEQAQASGTQGGFLEEGTALHNAIIFQDLGEPFVLASLR
jgi:hypothetical protein